MATIYKPKIRQPILCFCGAWYQPAPKGPPAPRCPACQERVEARKKVEAAIRLIASATLEDFAPEVMHRHEKILRNAGERLRKERLRLAARGGDREARRLLGWSMRGVA